jgi:hypothetical protein
MALASVVILLFQGTVAIAAALTCMQACAQKATLSCQPDQPSCHGGTEKAAKSQKQECGGACGSICSSDKAKATPVEGITCHVPTFEIAAVVPVLDVRDFGIPDAAPDFYETDSSPPRSSPISTHSLRAPPTCSA